MPAAATAPLLTTVPATWHAAVNDVLLTALADLPADVRVWVGGDGPQSAELRERFGHDRRIEWLGRISDDERGALYRYNPSALYVTAVSRYARVMRRDPLAFYAFYASGAGSP